MVRRQLGSSCVGHSWALSRSGPGWGTQGELGPIAAVPESGWGLFSSQCGPPSGTSSPPRANPFRALGKSQFHFRQAPAAARESPTSAVLSPGLCLLMNPAACTLPFPPLNSSAPYSSAFSDPTALLFWRQVHPGHSFQVLDCPCTRGRVRSLSCRLPGQLRAPVYLGEGCKEACPDMPQARGGRETGALARV